MESSFLCLAVIFHLFAFLCIFDIYFSSPIDPNIDNVIFKPDPSSGVTAPAKRLVFIVADGLRADTCFEFLGRDERYHNVYDSLGEGGDIREKHFQAAQALWPKMKTSFLRDILEASTSGFPAGWGVSHARVPTETRPGHVAVIAGFYEDVSAITKGWQDNPVEFDHVFNQSTYTWAWGSPDVTRMFSRKLEHVTDYYYSAYEEDFAREDLSMLDAWVFEHVTEFLQSTKNNASLYNQVHSNGVVFFLHLLGLDCNGHAHRPHSPEYLLNMASVDKGVEAMYKLFEDFFKDNRTAYVFTSDHGMGNKGRFFELDITQSRIGAHGDGDPTNTRTPLIVWGAGIEPSTKKNVKEEVKSWPIDSGFSAAEEAEFSRIWGLSHIERRDVEQADIAPLMSALIGIPVPSNSIGVLPLAHLRQGNYRASAIISNTKQLVEQVKFKETGKRSRLIWFKAYKVTAKELDLALSKVEELFHKGEFSKVEEDCLKILNVCQASLRYYQTYDRFYLIIILLSAYIGWVLYAASSIISKISGREEVSEYGFLPLVLGATFALLFAKQLFERSPISYDIYLAFAAYLCMGVARKWATLVGHFGRPELFALLEIKFEAFGLELMVAGYSYRSIYTLLFISLGIWIFTVPEFKKKKKLSFNSHTGKTVSLPAIGIKISWFFLCLVVGSFTTLSLDINDSPALLFAGSCLMLAILAGIYSTDMIGFSPFRIVQLGLIILATYLSLSTDYSLKLKKGLPLLNQILTCAIFPVAVYLPVYSYKTPLKRFLSVFAGLATPLVLLSVNYEVLFYSFLGANVYLWLIVERCIMYERITYQTKEILIDYPIQFNDIRTAFFFLLFIHISFMGHMDISHLSSFQISSTYRFTTVFSPFIMASLLIYKILLPYMMLTTCVSCISRERIISENSLLAPAQWIILVTMLSDFMALNLLFMVRDEGSWKDIGISITQYGFINAQVVFLPILFFLSSFYLKSISFRSDRSKG